MVIVSKRDSVNFVKFCWIAFKMFWHLLKYMGFVSFFL